MAQVASAVLIAVGIYAKIAKEKGNEASTACLMLLSFMIFLLLVYVFPLYVGLI